MMGANAYATHMQRIVRSHRALDMTHTDIHTYIHSYGEVGSYTYGPHRARSDGVTAQIGGQP